MIYLFVVCVLNVVLATPLPHSYDSKAVTSETRDPSDSKLQLLDSLISRLANDIDGYRTPDQSDDGSQLPMTSYDIADLGMQPYMDLPGSDVISKKRDFRPASSMLDGVDTKKTSPGSPNPGNDLDYLYSALMSESASENPGMTMSKRGHNPYRYSSWRSCDFSRLTREHILEYLRSGRLCGRRVSHVRFALSGRK